MEQQPFRLPIEARSSGQVRVAQVDASRTGEIAQLSRRTKLLGALAGLSRRERNQLAKVVCQATREVLKRYEASRIEWHLVSQEGQFLLETRLAGKAARSLELVNLPLENAQIAEWSRLVSRLDGKDWPRRAGVIRIGQWLSVEFNPPTASDLNDWRDVLCQATPEDGLATLYRRSRDKMALLTETRRRERSSDAAEGETLTLLSLVASKTDNAVAILDAAGNVEWSNAAFTRMTGHRSEQAVGLPLTSLLFRYHRDHAEIESFRELLSAGKSLTDERLLYRANGEAYWGTFNLTPVQDDAERLVHWIVIGSDTTRRREAQQALEAAKSAAEAASRAKSEFLANISHEIRTPMNAIIGMTELTLATDLGPDQRDYLHTVQNSAESLLKLLNDVLDLSKIEASRLEIEKIDFQLADLLRDTMRSLAVQAQAKHLDLNWRLPTTVPQQLRGDPVRLRQILINLVGNAIKFTEQGEVAVEVQPQWQNESEISLRFSVKDTGIGVPAERLDQIFEAFTQVDSSTTRTYGGTGLGLTITSELLRLMQGRIWVESELGKGSTFYFTVRFQPSLSIQLGNSLQPVLPLPNQPPAEGVAGERSLLVLVADDHASNRNLIAAILSKYGHRYVEVENGRQAVDRLQQHAFDAVLMDVQMPEMDGYQATAAIRQWERTTSGHVPIIAVTAHAMKGDREKCLAAGMDAYLPKPINTKELLRVLEQSSAPGGCEALSRAGAGPTPAAPAGPKSERPDGADRLPAGSAATGERHRLAATANAILRGRGPRNSRRD